MGVEFFEIVKIFRQGRRVNIAAYVHMDRPLQRGDNIADVNIPPVSVSQLIGILNAAKEAWR